MIIDKDESVVLATELTVAWLSNANTKATADEIPDVLRMMHESVRHLGSVSATNVSPTAEPAARAVSPRKSLANPDRIISMIDGKSYASLNRHIAAHGLTPSEYRTRFGLKADYPMIAPGYSAQRREAANKIGLGRRAATAIEQVVENVADAVVGKKGGRAASARGARRKKPD